MAWIAHGRVLVGMAATRLILWFSGVVVLAGAWAARGQDAANDSAAPAGVTNEAKAPEADKVDPKPKVAVTLPAKDEKTAQELAETSATLRQSLYKDFPGATVQKVKLKKSTNIVSLLMWDIPYSPDLEYQVTLRDPLNKDFKVKYTTHGSLESTDTFKTDRIPEKVAATMQTWAPGAELELPAEAKKRYGQPMLYKVRCRFEGRTYKAEILEDGTVRKLDQIPGILPTAGSRAPSPPSAPRNDQDTKAPAPSE